MLTQDTLLKFLKRRSAISIATLEREAQLPKNTLSGVLGGSRNLNEKNLLDLYPCKPPIIVLSRRCQNNLLIKDWLYCWKEFQKCGLYLILRWN